MGISAPFWELGQEIRQESCKITIYKSLSLSLSLSIYIYIYRERERVCITTIIYIL